MESLNSGRARWYLYNL